MANIDFKISRVKLIECLLESAGSEMHYITLELFLIAWVT